MIRYNITYDYTQPLFSAANEKAKCSCISSQVAPADLKSGSCTCIDTLIIATLTIPEQKRDRGQKNTKIWKILTEEVENMLKIRQQQRQWKSLEITWTALRVSGRPADLEVATSHTFKTNNDIC